MKYFACYDPNSREIIGTASQNDSLTRCQLKLNYGVQASRFTLRALHQTHKELVSNTVVLYELSMNDADLGKRSSNPVGFAVLHADRAGYDVQLVREFDEDAIVILHGI